MELKHIKGNTFCIDTGMTNLPFYKINDHDIVLMDTGYKIERNGIENILDSNDLRIVAIICSHAHIDHIENNTYFKDKYKCKLIMSRDEAFICSSAANLKTYFCSETISGIKDHYGEMICKTDIMVDENQNSINLFGVEFGLLHVKGHSADHLCILTPDDVAYLGDTLITYEVMKGSKIPYAFALKEDLKSKETLNELKNSVYVIAHKGIFTDISQLIADNIEFYSNKAEKICDLIEDYMTMEDLLKVVIKEFKIEVKTTYKYSVISRMLKSYVEYLIETKRINLIIHKGFLKYVKL